MKARAAGIGPNLLSCKNTPAPPINHNNITEDRSESTAKGVTKDIK